jgi:hypothetical protein
MALRTGSPNNLAAARNAFRQHKADRERYEAAGLGPGDAYRGLWGILHDYREEMLKTRSEKRRDYLMAQVATTLYRILPFERPRLQTVKLQGDPDAPIMDPDQLAETMAKTLTLDELELLDKVALKLVTGPAAPNGDGKVSDASGHATGAADQARPGRAGQGPAGRRKAAAGSRQGVAAPVKRFPRS